MSRIAITDRIQTSVSNLWFLAVTYSPDADQGLPARALLKWPLPGSPAPERGAAEPAFYRELGPSLGSPPVVRALAVAPSGAEPQWLVLEDLRSTHTDPVWPGRPADGALEGAVSMLATLHARWWEAPTLGRGVGTLHTEASLRAMVEGIAAHLPAFLEHLGTDLAAADRSALETVFGSPLRPWLRLTDERALTVTHGDAHPWNFLVPRSGDGDPYLIDWQLWHLDLGARDLAFLIALHWDREARRTVERPLLEHYHRQLASRGVTNYPLDALWLDYRRCAVRNLTFPIILWSRGMPADAWRRRLAYALAAYHDLGGQDLL